MSQLTLDTVRDAFTSMCQQFFDVNKIESRKIHLLYPYQFRQVPN